MVALVAKVPGHAFAGDWNPWASVLTHGSVYLHVLLSDLPVLLDDSPVQIAATRS
jgi:hypothetical protein